MEFEAGEIDRRQERRLFLTLMSLCGLVLAAGVVVGSDRENQPALALGDLTQAHIVEVRNAAGQTLLSGEFRTRTGPLGNIEKDAALTDATGSRVIGEVEIEVSRANAISPGQELEIDIIELAPRGTFTIVVDDRPVARFVTDDRGSVDLEIQSARPGGASR